MSGDRLSKLEQTVSDIRSSQAKIVAGQESVNRAIDGIQRSLALLADLRADTLHLVKMQSLDKEAHDEMFTRLRAAEDDINIQATSAKATAKRVSGLESNQKWLVVTVLGVLVVVFVKRALIG